MSGSSQDDVDRALAAFDAWPMLYHSFRNGPAYKLPPAALQLDLPADHAEPVPDTEAEAPPAEPALVQEPEAVRAAEPSAPAPEAELMWQAVPAEATEAEIPPSRHIVVQEPEPAPSAGDETLPEPELATGPESPSELGEAAVSVPREESAEIHLDPNSEPMAEREPPSRGPTKTLELFRWLSPAPDVDLPPTTLPEPAQPEAAQPEPAQPEPAQPEPAQLGPAQPGPAQPKPAPPAATAAEPTASEPAVSEQLLRWLMPSHRPGAAPPPVLPPEAPAPAAAVQPADEPERMFRRLSAMDTGGAGDAGETRKGVQPPPFRPAAPAPVVPAPFPPSLPGLHDLFRRP